MRQIKAVVYSLGAIAVTTVLVLALAISADFWGRLVTVAYYG